MNHTPSGPVPRRQGRYLVVAPGTVFPKICVRTGRKDDLVEIEEEARTSRSVERIVGALGALFAYETGLVRYYIHRAELARLRRLRRLCSRVIIAGIVILVIGLVLMKAPVIIAGFAVTVCATSCYALIPAPLSIAAVWGGQVFLLKVPSEIVENILKGYRS